MFCLLSVLLYSVPILYILYHFMLYLAHETEVRILFRLVLKLVKNSKFLYTYQEGILIFWVTISNVQRLKNLVCEDGFV